MRIGKARKAIQKLAIREGVSEREICREIEETMLEAMQQARERSDWETLERWAKIPHHGQQPTAYELVAYLAEEIHKADKV